MIVDITYDELVSNQHEIHTIYTIRNNFYTKLISYLNKYGVTEVITNAKIAVIFQDCTNYTIRNLTSIHVGNSLYLAGGLGNINVWVNPQMRWIDSKIIVKDNLLVMRKNKILKIIKGKEFVDVLEEILIDSKLADFLI